jgi:acetyl esterase/lipase
LTLDKQWLAAEGLDPDRDIAGTIGLAGPYDFLPFHDPELDTIFAPAGDLRLSQPITFARGNAPPMLLAAGTADQTVLPRNTQHLVAAIRRDGGSVEERLYPGVNHTLYPGVDHTKIIGAMAGMLHWLAPSMADATAFLDRHTSAATRSPAATVRPGPAPGPVSSVLPGEGPPAMLPGNAPAPGPYPGLAGPLTIPMPFDKVSFKGITAMAP